MIIFSIYDIRFTFLATIREQLVNRKSNIVNERFFPPAPRDSVSLRGDTSAPVISPQHPDNRRVFSYGGGGLKVRRWDGDSEADGGGGLQIACSANLMATSEDTTP